MERLLLKVPEVAARLSMSRGKVYELMRSGALPSVRIDRTRRIRTRDLEAFVGSLDGGGPGGQVA
jgi:excisionase family DNA binding protein